MNLIWNGIKCINYNAPVDTVPTYTAPTIHAVLLPGWYVEDTSKNPSGVSIVPPGGTEYYTS